MENVELVTITGNDPDPDREPDAESPLTFTLQNDFNGRFAIGESDGVVTVLKALDHEEAVDYRLTVEMSDKADRLGVSLVSTQQLIVDVIDVPDEPPRFISSVGIHDLVEDTEAGTQLFSITAEDGDFNSDNELTYLTYSVVNITDGCKLKTFNFYLEA